MVCCVWGWIWVGGVITTPRVVDSLGWVWVGGWWAGGWWWLRARQSGLGSIDCEGCEVGEWVGEWWWLVRCVGGWFWGGGVITTPSRFDSVGLVWVWGWWVGG